MAMFCGSLKNKKILMFSKTFWSPLILIPDLLGHMAFLYLVTTWQMVVLKLCHHVEVEKASKHVS